MFTTTLQTKFLKSITGQLDDGLIHPMYLGLLYDFEVSKDLIGYDPATGEPIYSDEYAYKFKEPWQQYEKEGQTFAGDSSYKRKFISNCDSAKFSPLKNIVIEKPEGSEDLVAYISNDEQDIAFNEASIDWPEPITHVGIFNTDVLDTDNTKKLLMYAKFDTSKEVKAESIPLFKAGNFKITTN